METDVDRRAAEFWEIDAWDNHILPFIKRVRKICSAGEKVEYETLGAAMTKLALHAYREGYLEGRRCVQASPKSRLSSLANLVRQYMQQGVVAVHGGDARHYEPCF
jgi:hypothetical protein